MKHRYLLLSFLLIFTIGGLSGCAQFISRSSSSQPLNTLLEKTKDSRQTDDKKPLRFPASVAVIFVPSKNNDIPETALRLAGKQLKHQLLANPKYIRSVTLISADDLRAKVSLDQIRTMYDADIAVILSYKQDQTSQQSGPGGLIDATLVGAFIVPSVKTETSTIVDGMIVHIASNALIFRETGSDNSSTLSTSYGVTSTMADQSIKGVLAATDDFGNAVTKTLTKFDNYDLSRAISLSVLTATDSGDGTANKSANDSWNKVDNFKFGGAGSLDIWTLALVIPFAWIAHARNHQGGRWSGSD